MRTPTPKSKKQSGWCDCMDKETAELIAENVRKDIANNPLHFGDPEVEVVETIGVGWKVEIY